MNMSIITVLITDWLLIILETCWKCADYPLQAKQHPTVCLKRESNLESLLFLTVSSEPLDAHVLIREFGMLRRPKPSDSEADLLREQQELLAAGGQSTVTVVKRPDKRRGDAAAAAAQEPGKQRDVVTIEGRIDSSELLVSYLKTFLSWTNLMMGFIRPA